MNDSKSFITNVLFKLSEGRNKDNFVEFLNECVFDHVIVEKAWWSNEKVLTVEVKNLPFYDINLSQEGSDFYSSFVETHSEDIFSVDVKDEKEVIDLSQKLNVLFHTFKKRLTIDKVKDGVKEQGEIYRETVSKNLPDGFEVYVLVKPSEVFTDTAIKKIVGG